MIRTIDFNTFKLRPYQENVFNSFFRGDKSRYCMVWPRRAGKDQTWWIITVLEALRRPANYAYCLPTFSAARKVIWQTINNEGRRMIDYIPPELIEKINEQQMYIRLVNGSMIQLIGSNSYNQSIVGTNWRGIVFSEYQLADERAYLFAKPILNANGGWCAMIGTPRHHNHFYKLAMIAKDSPYWFYEFLTLDDTKHISKDEIEKEREEGIISEDMIQQEYYCSWNLGVGGSYYTKYLDRLRLNGQIGKVPYNPAYLTHTAWDLGYSDPSAIIWFQLVDGNIHIIDCYEKNKEDLEHFIHVVRNKSYQYGTHIAPHDMNQHSLETGFTRKERARMLGLEFEVLNRTGLYDGIEAVKSNIGRCYIDEVKCAPLIKSLDNYRKKYDEKLDVYLEEPLHDKNSHFADSMRYLVLGLPRIMHSSDPELSNRLWHEVNFGNNFQNSLY